MVSFPADFRELDGRFLDLLPGDFVPILYGTRDGSWVCAECLNAARADLDPASTDDPAWRIAGFDLLYEGPPESCDACSRDIKTLYGDPDES